MTTTMQQGKNPVASLTSVMPFVIAVADGISRFKERELLLWAIKL